MRFAEVENPRATSSGSSARMAACTARSGCLKACPSPGCHRPIPQRIVDFHERLVSARLLHHRLSLHIPRISKKDHKAYKCTLCSDRVSVGLEPACIKLPDGCLCSAPSTNEIARAERLGLKSRGFENAGLYDPSGSGWHTRHVCVAFTRIRPTSITDCHRISRQSHRSPLEGFRQTGGARAHGHTVLAGSSTTFVSGRMNQTRVMRGAGEMPGPPQ